MTVYLYYTYIYIYIYIYTYICISGDDLVAGDWAEGDATSVAASELYEFDRPFGDLPCQGYLFYFSFYFIYLFYFYLLFYFYVLFYFILLYFYF